VSESLDPDVIAFAGRVFDMARNGSTEELAAYLGSGLPPNLTNDKGDTLLILAAYHCHAGAVAALLEHGADPDRVNDRGQTALAAAVFRQSADIVAQLLAVGADPDAGGPSARATAQFFELAAMTDLLDDAVRR
jgi:ankyrin repeat protein